MWSYTWREILKSVAVNLGEILKRRLILKAYKIISGEQMAFILIQE